MICLGYADNNYEWEVIYIETLYSSLDPAIEPVYYKIAFAVFVLMVITGNRLIPDKWCRRKNVFPLAVLVTYIFLVIASTILSRTSYGVHTYELLPFWSYIEIIQHRNMFIFWEVVLNVIMMIPAGFLFPLSFNRTTFKGVIIFTVGIELFIEFMQLVLCRGLAEWDDVIHGAAGAAIGYGICRMIMKIKSIIHGM